MMFVPRIKHITETNHVQRELFSIEKGMKLVVVVAVPDQEGCFCHSQGDLGRHLTNKGTQTKRIKSPFSIRGLFPHVSNSSLSPNPLPWKTFSSSSSFLIGFKKMN